MKIFITLLLMDLYRDWSKMAMSRLLHKIDKMTIVGVR
jgi:hypothetical protein